MPAKKKRKVDVADLGRDERLSFRCPAVLRQAIEAHAKRDRRSVSDWIVLALDEIVNRREDDKNQREGY